MNALEMALEALTNPSTIAVSHAVELIKAELAKPLPKPVAWWNPEYESDFAIALNKFQGWNVPLYALNDEVKHD